MKQDDIFIFLYKSYYRQNHATITKKQMPYLSQTETKFHHKK